MDQVGGDLLALLCFNGCRTTRYKLFEFYCMFPVCHMLNPKIVMPDGKTPPTRVSTILGNITLLGQFAGSTKSGNNDCLIVLMVLQNRK